MACRSFSIQFAVKGDNAAERGGRVGFVRAIVSIKNGIADSHAARVGVLHNHTCRFGELFHALQRRIGIGDVVIREGFTLNLGCGSNGGFFHILFYIEGSLLVAVLAVRISCFLMKFRFSVRGKRPAASLFSPW